MINPTIKETEDVQNVLGSLFRETVLNMPTADTRTKRQFSKAMIALEKARSEFDLLNDLKAELREPRETEMYAP